MQQIIEVKNYTDFDILTSLGMWSGNCELTLKDINKRFFLDYISKNKDMAINSENNESISIYYPSFGELKEGKIKFKDDSFYLPFGFPSISHEYIRFIESLGFEKIQAKSVIMNLD